MTKNTEVPKKMPTALEAPEITRPKENGSVSPENRYMEGTAVAGNMVRGYSVYDQLNPIFGVQVGDDGKWRHFLTLPKGMHLVFANQSPPDNPNVVSPASSIRKFHMT